MKLFSSELNFLTNVREFGAWATHGDANVPAMPCNVDENAALRVDGVTHAKSLRAVAVEAVQEHRNVDTEVISKNYVRKVYDGDKQQVCPWYLTMSPSFMGRRSGIPWQTQLLTEVQTDLGKPR